MIRIVQVVDSLNAGGSERVAVELANGLHGMGYYVSFCVTRAEGILKRELNPEIDFIHLRRKSRLQGLFRFRKFVLRKGIAVVHAHGNSTAMFCSVALWGLREVKIIHHDHNPRLASRNILLQRLLLKRVHKWVAVSADIHQWVMSRIDHQGALVMINPLLTSRFVESANKTQNKKRIVVLANYKEAKDYENLVAAVNKLRVTSLNFHIACFGGQTSGAYYKRVKSIVKELALEELISLNPSENDVPGVLGRSDIGLLASKHEGLPIALLEYMASGLPVVVTDVGECKRIVEEADCGVVVSPGDPVALANAILRLADGEGEWRRFGLNGRAYVEKNHSIDSYLRKLVLEVYEV